jgi:single-stranded DNA-binding protein
LFKPQSTKLSKEGKKQGDAQYHTAVVFGPQAKPAAKYLKKGQLVLIEGRLEHRSWEGNDGTTKLLYRDHRGVR